MRRRSKHGIDRDEWHLRAREFVLRGNALPHARLNPDLVREIRANRRKWTNSQWAAFLGVHIRTIEDVQAYRTWSHVA